MLIWRNSKAYGVFDMCCCCDPMTTRPKIHVLKVLLGHTLPGLYTDSSARSELTSLSALDAA